MLDHAALLQHAADGALLLAPNLRAARQLRRHLSAATASSASQGAMDVVLHWRAWTARLWQEALLHGVEERALLTSMQERLLWEQLLEQGGAIDRSDALVDLCLSAVALVYRHGAGEEISRTQPTDIDAAHFARWFHDFEQECRERSLLPSATLEGALATHLAEKRLTLPARIVLCGVADLSPAQLWLLECARRAGTEVVDASPSAAHKPALHLLRCKDAEDELRSLTDRAEELFRAGVRSNLAVIVPDLSASRGAIDRAMRERFAVASSKGLHEDRHPLWEFSTGRPLASFSLVADAVRLLTWTVRDLEASELSALLRSPYLAWPVDRDRAASLDAVLLRRWSHLRATWCMREAAHTFHSLAPELSEVLDTRTHTWNGLHKSVGSFSGSVQRIRALLKAFGWPGPRARTSEEFQVVQRWESLLDDLATLDVLGSQTAWRDFLDRLNEATRDTTFARENTGAPIQFLTPDESTGIECDAAWIVHANEPTWSSHRALHPLLPVRLQRQFGMPGADPQLDGEHFRAQVERIAQLAPTITFTYAHRSGEGEQRASAAVCALAGIEQRDQANAGALPALQAAAPLQKFVDDASVPLTLSATPVCGGVRVLQSQAACAFRAFAELRLGSAAVESTDLGMDARERGDLLHRSLQTFWETTRDRAGLQALIDAGRLFASIEHAITHALTPEERAADAWSRSYLSIQRERLTWLLDRWLRKEAERPDFRVVATEKTMTVAVGPLALNVKVDRIDEVTVDGETVRVIVDYKTGDPKARKWEGNRPEEPQLPLYATATPLGTPEDPQAAPPPPVGAITFAVVRAGNGMEFRSLPHKSALLQQEKGVTAALDMELEGWRAVLQTLAEDFAAGTATVGPKEYPSTCRFCEQRMLCRLNPELLDNEAEESEANA